MKKDELAIVGTTCSFSATILFIISIIITSSHIINTPIVDMIYSWICLAFGWVAMGVSYICRKIVGTKNENDI